MLKSRRRSAASFGAAAAAGGALLLLAGPAAAPASAAARTTTRDAKPLVVIFAPRYPAPVRPGPASGRPTAPAKPADDEELTAMRAVRELLQRSRLVEAIAYYPDAPMFARAQAENKIRLADPLRLTPDERLVLARAVGAQHLIVANFVRGDSESGSGTASPEPAAGGTAIELQSIEVATRKAWSVRQRVSLSVPAPNPGFNVAPATYSQETLSAANSVVQKFLSGRSATTPARPPPPGHRRAPRGHRAFAGRHFEYRQCARPNGAA
jgi:hypothetical protein